MSIFIPVIPCPHATDLPLPAYGTVHSAGMDLSAAIPEPITLAPLSRHLIPVGFSMALPEGYEAQIRPRSGLALKHGITVLNSPGTIDADYRDEIKVLLINLGQEPFLIERGMRIAQMVIGPFMHVTWNPIEAHTGPTTRAGGFGSTGIK